MKIKKLSQISAITAAMASIAVQPMTVSAADLFFETEENELDGHNLEITADYDTTADLPLSLSASSEIFYFNANLSPGDVAKSTVAIQNISKGAISVSITDIENMLPDDPKAALLLDILELTIDIDGKAYYQGKHSELAAPFMPYVSIEPGDSVNLNITMSFPRDADNRYQGAKYKMKWVFDAIVDEAPEETTTPAPEPDPIVTETPAPAKTGVEEEEKSSPVKFVVIAVACVLVAALVAVPAVLKRKKDKK